MKPNPNPARGGARPCRALCRILLAAVLLACCTAPAAAQSTNTVKIYALPEATTINDDAEVIINLSTNAGDTRRTSWTNLLARMAAHARGPVTGATNNTTTNASRFGLFDLKAGSILKFLGIEQGTNVILYFNGSNIVINAQPGGTGSSTTTNFNTTAHGSLLASNSLGFGSSGRFSWRHGGGLAYLWDDQEGTAVLGFDDTTPLVSITPALRVAGSITATASNYTGFLKFTGGQTPNRMARFGSDTNLEPTDMRLAASLAGASDGQGLVYNAACGCWTNATVGGSGEVNILGDAGLTNATRHSLAAPKSGVTLVIKTISAGYGLGTTNEGGTNIITAIIDAELIEWSGISTNLFATTNSVHLTQFYSRQGGSALLTNLAGLASTNQIVFTNDLWLLRYASNGVVAAAGTGLGVVSSGSAGQQTFTLSITDAELLEWIGISTNKFLTTNHAQLQFASSNNVRVAAGTALGVTGSGSAGVQTWTVALTDADLLEWSGVSTNLFATTNSVHLTQFYSRQGGSAILTNLAGLASTNQLVFTNDAWLTRVASNGVVVAAGTGISVSSSGSGGQQTFTVTATGGSSSTNPVAFAAGSIYNSNSFQFQGSGMFLRTTNLWADGGVSSLYSNVFAANAGGLTNILATNILDGQTVTLWFFASNGVTVGFPQFVAADYTDGFVVTPRTNAWTKVEISRRNTITNIAVATPGLALKPGNGVVFTTNFATGELTAVLDTNITIYGRTSLDVVTNVNAIVWNTETRLIPTNSALSNIVVNFGQTNRIELWFTNNLTFTNWVTPAAGSADLILWLRPQLIPRGINWGNLGFSNPGYSVAIGTNANNPLWTTLTNGKTYTLTLTRAGTNIIPALALWE